MENLETIAIIQSHAKYRKIINKPTNSSRNLCSIPKGSLQRENQFPIIICSKNFTFLPSIEVDKAICTLSKEARFTCVMMSK